MAAFRATRGVFGVPVLTDDALPARRPAHPAPSFSRERYLHRHSAAPLCSSAPVTGRGYFSLRCATQLVSRQSNESFALVLGSPISIYISYWHGQLDVIPTAFFLLCLTALRQKHFTIGLALYGLALATKTHLLIALPFIVVYIAEERDWTGRLKALTAGATVYFLSLIPYIFRPEFRRIVFHNPEQLRALALQIHLGPDMTILVMPLALCLLWIRFYGYAKHNWDLFMLYMGMVFCAFISLSPPAPGYFFWSMPFVVYFLCRSKDVDRRFYLLFNALYLAFVVVNAGFHLPIHNVTHGTLDALLPDLDLRTVKLQGLVPMIFTLMQAANAAIIYQMYAFGIRSNSIYRALSRSTVIGIAGDSGAGKDYVTTLLRTLLGPDESTCASGDNYHRWPRGHAMWSIYTHLDARANHLHQQFEHVVKLSQGKDIVTGIYDHNTGTFQQNVRVKSSRYVFLTGLHSLMLDSQRSVFDLKIFLDTEDNLREYWKVRRDSATRGQSPAQVLSSLEKRKPDRDKFILPQRELADLVVRTKYDGKIDFNGFSPLDPMKMVLELHARNGFNWGELAEAFEAVPSLRVTHEPFSDFYWQKMIVSGQIPASTVKAIAVQIFPNLDEIATGLQFAERSRRMSPACFPMLFDRPAEVGGENRRSGHDTVPFLERRSA